MVRSQASLTRFCSSGVIKGVSDTSSPSVHESPSASASEHAVANASEAILKSRTWNEHQLTADQLQFRSLASVRDHFFFLNTFWVLFLRMVS